MKKLLTLLLLAITSMAFAQTPHTDAYLKSYTDSLIRKITLVSKNVANTYQLGWDSKVSILSPKLGTSSTVGYVWTATNTSGAGSWQASAAGTVTAVNGTTNRITSTGGATPTIDISSTFEALLGKVANPLSQFASTTSSQFAGVISDETGTGSVVFSASPALTGTPTAPTASGGTNTTQIATTAHVFVNYQPKDTDLTTIAQLTPSNNDFMQFKSGGWANRTVAQVKTDLGIEPIDTTKFWKTYDTTYITKSILIYDTLGYNSHEWRWGKNDGSMAFSRETITPGGVWNRTVDNSGDGTVSSYIEQNYNQVSFGVNGAGSYSMGLNDDGTFFLPGFTYGGSPRHYDFTYSEPITLPRVSDGHYASDIWQDASSHIIKTRYPDNSDTGIILQTRALLGSTDNNVPRWNGTDGWLLQGSKLNIDDNGNVVLNNDNITDNYGIDFANDPTGSVNFGDLSVPTKKYVDDAVAAGGLPSPGTDGQMLRWNTGALENFTPFTSPGEDDGDIPVFDGSDYVALPKGSSNTFLGVNGSGVLGYYSNPGVTDGDKGALTISSSGTVYALNNGVVTGSKIASSAALAGSPTTTTQAALDNSTKISTTAYADRAAGQFATKGNVINEAFTSSFANYTSAGTATWSIVSNTLQGAGGTSMVLTDYVRHSGWGNTAVRNFSATTEVIVGTIGTNSHGVWIGFQGNGVANASSVHFVLRLNTARQGFLESYINGATTATFARFSTTALTVATGDRVKLVLDVIDNKYIFRAINLTQTSVQPVSLIRTTSPVVGTPWANYNTGQFALGVCGGTHQFDYHTVNVNDPVAPDILFAGHSVPTGAGVINLEQSYPKQFENLTGLKVMRWSGGGNQARDIRGADIIKYADPTKTKIIIDIGVNDIIGSRTSTNIITDINQIITDLGAGWTLGTNLFILEVLPYTTFASQVQTYNTVYQTNYAAGLIRVYKSFDNGTGGMQSTLVNADGLHPNELGHELIATYIYQDLRDRGIITASTKAESNLNPVYEYEGNVGIGSPNPFTPAYPLQVMSSGKQQFMVGSDATNPTYGGGLVSSNATHLSLRSGMYFDGSNNISSGTAGQSEIVLQDAALTWRSNNSSIAAGSSVGTMTSHFRISNSGLVGIGSSVTTPLSQLHISSEATTSRGITLDLHASVQSGSQQVFRKSRGTFATPTTVIDTDYGSLNIFQQYSGSSYLSNVSMGTRVNGTVTTSSVPTDFFIATSAAGSIDPYTDGIVRMLVSSTGKVGIGTTSPTAWLNLRAGSATANTAPLKLTTGTALTSPEDGALEYHTSHLYFTIGSTRYQIDQQAGIGGTTGSTDNRIIRADGTGGATIQSSPVAIDDSGNITGVTSIDVTGNQTATSTTYKFKKITRGLTQLNGSTTGSMGEAVGTGEMSNGESVTIEVTWTAKDDDTNTGAGGKFLSVWTKSGGTLHKVYDNNTPAVTSDTGDNIVLASADGGSDNITISIGTGSIGGNFSASAIAEVLIRKP